MCGCSFTRSTGARTDGTNTWARKLSVDPRNPPQVGPSKCQLIPFIKSSLIPALSVKTEFIFRIFLSNHILLTVKYMTAVKCSSFIFFYFELYERMIVLGQIESIWGPATYLTVRSWNSPGRIKVNHETSQSGYSLALFRDSNRGTPDFNRTLSLQKVELW